MILEYAQRLEDVAKLLNAKYVGDPNHLITGINEIHQDVIQ
jgi:hypothetical protein